MPLTWDGGYFVTGRTKSDGSPELFNLDWLAEKCNDYGVDWLTSRFDISRKDLADIIDRADDLAAEEEDFDDYDESFSRKLEYRKLEARIRKLERILKV